MGLLYFLVFRVSSLDLRSDPNAIWERRGSVCGAHAATIKGRRCSRGGGSAGLMKAEVGGGT